MNRQVPDSLPYKNRNSGRTGIDCKNLYEIEGNSSKMWNNLIGESK